MLAISIANIAVLATPFYLYYRIINRSSREANFSNKQQISFILIETLVGTYYFTYIMGNLALLGMVGLLGLISPIILLLFPIALKRIGSVEYCHCFANRNVYGYWSYTSKHAKQLFCLTMY